MSIQRHFHAVPISEIAEVNPKGPGKAELKPDAEVDFLPMADLHEDGSVHVADRRSYKEVAKGYTAFKDGDVLIAKITPCFENNKIGIAKVKTEWAFGSTEFHVLRPSGRVDASYLTHFLRQDSVRNEGEKRMTGSGGQRRVPKAFIEDLPIPLPPLEEQRRIAAILDQADALRRLRSRALDKLNTLGQAIFHEMFGDVVTNPLGWDSIKLDKLCEVGSSKRVFVQEFVSDGVPFYRGTEVGRLGSGGRIEPSLFISAEHYESLIKQSGKPAIGDLLLPSICHDGRIWKVDHSDPFYFKDGRVLWIKSGKSKIDSEYLRGYLRNLFLKSYASIASGTTFAELKIVNLKNLPILCPPMRLQKEFSSRIAEVEACRSKFAQTTSASMSLFASLQYRAFKGEL